MISKKKYYVLITGANGFLGQHLSKFYLEKNFSLILLARSFDEGFKDFLLNNSNDNNTVDFFICNLLDENTTIKAIDSIKAKYQSINVLINNAATQEPINYAEDMDIDDWRRSIELNLNIPVKFSIEMIPLLKKNDFSSIINISGGGATSPRVQFSAYAAAKSALVRFTEVISLELEKYNIHVNSIAPGIMPSRMMQDIQSNEKVNENEKKVADQSLDNAFDIHEVLELFYFLSTKASEGITGRLISAKWDNWKYWPNNIEELKNNDLYTLRRIIAKNKGFNWGDK